MLYLMCFCVAPSVMCYCIWILERCNKSRTVYQVSWSLVLRVRRLEQNNRKCNFCIHFVSNLCKPWTRVLSQRVAFWKFRKQFSVNWHVFRYCCKLACTTDICLNIITLPALTLCLGSISITSRRCVLIVFSAGWHVFKHCLKLAHANACFYCLRIRR